MTTACNKLLLLGLLTPQEFIEMMRGAQLGLDNDLILELFLGADTDGDGYINYTEFLNQSCDVSNRELNR